MQLVVISGFLGSGKTTLMRRLLRTCRHWRLGAIVNDLSDLEVDGDLIRDPDWLNEARGNSIGLERDRAVFVPELHECFCTDPEIARWRSGGSFDDPWPKTLRRV